MKTKLLILLLLSILTANSQKNYSKIADSIFDKHKTAKKFIFQQHFWGDEEGNVAVAIGNLFDARIRSAVVVASENDSVYAIRVYRKSETWEQVANFKHEHHALGHMDDILDFVDLDGDGIKDLVLLDDYLDLRASSVSHAWLYKKGELKFVENLDAFPNFTIDKATKTIISYISCGCADFCMLYQIGEIIGGKVALRYAIQLDCCEMEGGRCNVSINDAKPFCVKSPELYKQVPKSYQHALRRKMRQ